MGRASPSLQSIFCQSRAPQRTGPVPNSFLEMLVMLSHCHHRAEPVGVLVADTAAITGHWNNITALVVPSNITLLDTAELFAKLQLSFYDSNIQGWYIKYHTLFWRPVTAIR